jgi:hypothetical protein
MEFCSRGEKMGSILNATRKSWYFHSRGGGWVPWMVIIEGKHRGCRGFGLQWPKGVLAKDRPGAQTSPGEGGRWGGRSPGWGFWLDWLNRILVKTGQCRDKQKSPTSGPNWQQRKKPDQSLVKEKVCRWKCSKAIVRTSCTFGVKRTCGSDKSPPYNNF